MTRTISLMLFSLVLFVDSDLATAQSKGGQQDDDKRDDRFTVVANEIHTVMIDKETGRSWILKSDGRHQKWVPLERIDSVAKAQQWLKQNGKSDTKSKMAKAANNGKNPKKPKTTDEFADWATDIVIQLEYGKGKSAVRKWKSPPTLSTFGANKAQKQLIENIVEQINAVLAKTRFGKVEIIAEEDEDADMQVYFVKFDQFPEVAKARGFKLPNMKNAGLFAINWNEDFNITDATILLATDHLLREEDLKHIALEEVVQALGMANDSPLDNQSIFYSARGGPTRLSENDQIVLEVLYSKLQAGYGRSATRRAYRNYMLKKQRAAVKD